MICTFYIIVKYGSNIKRVVDCSSLLRLCRMQDSINVIQIIQVIQFSHHRHCALREMELPLVIIKFIVHSCLQLLIHEVFYFFLNHSVLSLIFETSDFKHNGIFYSYNSFSVTKSTSNTCECVVTVKTNSYYHSILRQSNQHSCRQ